MFGILYLFGQLFNKTAHYIQEDISNQEQRERAIKNNATTYIDYKGKTRLTNSNEIVYMGTNSQHDRILKKENGTELINYSQQERNAIQDFFIKDAKGKNKTVYCISVKHPKLDRSTAHISGMKYKDFKTGEIYVIRKLNGVYFYMDIKTCMLVRYADYSGGDYRIQHCKININEFNQKRIKEGLDNMNNIEKYLNMYWPGYAQEEASVLRCQS